MTSSCSSTGFSTSPTAGEGRGGEGCSFPTVPKIRRWPKPTIPRHRTGNLKDLSLWNHPLSSKDVPSISSSILSTTRCSELYVRYFLERKTHHTCKNCISTVPQLNASEYNLLYFWEINPFHTSRLNFQNYFTTCHRKCNNGSQHTLRYIEYVGSAENRYNKETKYNPSL